MQPSKNILNPPSKMRNIFFCTSSQPSPVVTIFVFIVIKQLHCTKQHMLCHLESESTHSYVRFGEKSFLQWGYEFFTFSVGVWILTIFWPYFFFFFTRKLIFNWQLVHLLIYTYSQHNVSTISIKRMGICDIKRYFISWINEEWCLGAMVGHESRSQYLLLSIVILCWFCCRNLPPFTPQN